jgi:hypothetical protein
MHGNDSHLARLGRGPLVFVGPQPKRLQHLLDRERVRDERNDPQLAPALPADHGVGLVDLVDQPRPARRAPRCPRWRPRPRAQSAGRRTRRRRHSGADSAGRPAGGIVCARRGFPASPNAPGTVPSEPRQRNRPLRASQTAAHAPPQPRSRELTVLPMLPRLLRAASGRRSLSRVPGRGSCPRPKAPGGADAPRRGRDVPARRARAEGGDGPRGPRGRAVRAPLLPAAPSVREAIRPVLKRAEEAV